MILCHEEYAKKINSAVFPGQQGGPLEHVDRRQGRRAARSPRPRPFRSARSARSPARRPSPRSCWRPAHGRRRPHRRHRRAPRARRPARLRARRPAGRGPPARDRHHGQPQRGAVRPAPADGLQRPARRHAGARHPRPAGRGLRARSARIIATALTPDFDGVARPSWPSASARSPTATRSTRTWAAPARRSSRRSAAGACSTDADALVAVVARVRGRGGADPARRRGWRGASARSTRRASAGWPRARRRCSAAWRSSRASLRRRAAVPARRRDETRGDPRRRGADHRSSARSTTGASCSPAAKLAGQMLAALILVLSGVRVENVTLPFLGRVDFGELGRAADRCSASWRS